MRLVQDYLVLGAFVGLTVSGQDDLTNDPLDGFAAIDMGLNPGIDLGRRRERPGGEKGKTAEEPADINEESVIDEALNAAKKLEDSSIELIGNDLFVDDGSILASDINIGAVLNFYSHIRLVPETHANVFNW